MSLAPSLLYETLLLSSRKPVEIAWVMIRSTECRSAAVASAAVGPAWLTPPTASSMNCWYVLPQLQSQPPTSPARTAYGPSTAFEASVWCLHFTRSATGREALT